MRICIAFISTLSESQFPASIFEVTPYLNLRYTNHMEFLSSFELPDDVFSEGEVKPTKASKKKRAGTKKRGASEAGIDEVRILPKQVSLM